MTHELIEKHFNDRTEYHVVFMENKIIKASKIFLIKEEAERYLDSLEKP
tara:strand:- start:7623 stop:7769 length:147 start_codon:yes stop_codon:yes gene_type:complete